MVFVLHNQFNVISSAYSFNMTTPNASSTVIRGVRTSWDGTKIRYYEGFAVLEALFLADLSLSRCTPWYGVDPIDQAPVIGQIVDVELRGTLVHLPHDNHSSEDVVEEEKEDEMARDTNCRQHA